MTTLELKLGREGEYFARYARLYSDHKNGVTGYEWELRSLDYDRLCN